MTPSEEYEHLLDLFFQLVQSQSGKPISAGEEWRNDAQTLSIKLFRHLSSMRDLANGGAIVLPGVPPVPHIDHSSIKVLARAALETYLVFHYLFGASNEELCQFRHRAWMLGGLCDRQGAHVSVDEHKEKLKAEKRQIEELRTQLKASPHLENYTEKQKKQLLNGNWRIGNNWGDLGANADFSKKYFDDIYSYLCGYSHASYISALQVGQAKSMEDQIKLTDSILRIGMVIMAHYVFSYSSIHSATLVLDQNPEAKQIAEQGIFAQKICGTYISTNKQITSRLRRWGAGFAAPYYGR